MLVRVKKYSLLSHYELNNTEELNYIQPIQSRGERHPMPLFTLQIFVRRIYVRDCYILDSTLIGFLFVLTLTVDLSVQYLRKKR